MATVNDVCVNVTEQDGRVRCISAYIIDGVNMSVGELSELPYYAEELKRLGYDVGSAQCLYFHRLRAKRQGQGHGTCILEALTALWDDRGLWVWCDLNPYDGVSHARLGAFYARHGFEYLPLDGSGSMVRKPRDIS